MAKTVQVDIHGQRYALRSELEPQYVHELAGFLDERMRAAARELADTDALGVAVVAALNLADELHRLRASTTGEAARLSTRTAELEQLIDMALDLPAPASRAINE